MATAIVIIVGDEILEGHTHDTNSHYLAKRLSARGIDLRRIVTVPDDVDEISATVEDAIQRNPHYVFVCGGIGPTPDDRTYQGVAIALQKPLIIDPLDLAWLKDRIAERGYGQGLLDDPATAEGLLRMVRRPDGTRAIENPVGAALGTFATLGTTNIIVLPGVPRELNAMMETRIEPNLLAAPTEPRTLIELELVHEEARLYPILHELEMKNPGLKLGSYPQDDRGRILLRLQGATGIVEGAAERLIRVTGARRLR